MLVFAQLSDTHLDGTARPSERARSIMDYLEGLPYDLDAVLVTGDIADHGLAAEYDEARKILSSRHPVLICPGNHDVRGPFREVLLGEPGGDGPVNQVYRTPAGVFALCDSSIPGRAEGHLADETLAWLEDVLAETPSGVPVLVVFHHPPAVLHNPAIDKIKQRGEERLAELVGRRPNIAALICGHAHTPAATTFAGRPLLVAPGVVSTIKFPWEQTDGGEFPLDLESAPAFYFHVLDDDGRLTTHLRIVP